MSNIFFIVALCVAFFGCTSSKHPPGGEGEEELDPGVEDLDDDAAGDGEGGVEEDLADDTGLVPGDIIDLPVSDAEVCYPGPLSDYSVCFPLVDHSDEMGDAYDYPEPYLGSEQYLPPIRFLDLNVLEHDQSLSANFVLGEFMHKAKGQFGLYQVHAVESLQAIREATGGPLYANSGYRNVHYNEDVGGAEWSRHLYGDAMDMYSNTVSLSELAEICEDFGAGFTKEYVSHVHCDWRDDPLDPAFFE